MRACRSPMLSMVSMTLGATALLSLATTPVAATSCSAKSHCPSDTPCCMGGTCGKGPMYCANGCNPSFSHDPASCAPNPVCKDLSLNFTPEDYNNSNYFMPMLNYNGTADTPFTLDMGFLGKGSDGVALLMTQATQTKLSSTNYMLYGEVEAGLKHDARAGLVATFITMSDTEDEIDYEFATNDPTNVQTNTFGMQKNRQPETVNQTKPWSVSDLHVYGFNWQPDKLEWKLDGKVIRTLKADTAKGYYPQSPSRIQFSIWAGGNATEPEGVRQWAGGDIDWDTDEYQKDGYYPYELVNYTMKCSHAQSSPTRRDGGNNDTVTSWTYNGKSYTDNHHVEHSAFTTSTAPLERLSDIGWGGGPGMPGYVDSKNPQVKNGNSWDGSGKQLDSTVRKDSGGKAPKQPMSSHTKAKIGIIVGVVVGAVLIAWVILVYGCRRYWRNKKDTDDEPYYLPASNSAGSAAVPSLGGAGGGARYAPLHDAGSEVKLASTPAPEYPPPRSQYAPTPTFAWQQNVPGAPGLPPTASTGYPGSYGQPAGPAYHYPY